MKANRLSGWVTGVLALAAVGLFPARSIAGQECPFPSFVAIGSRRRHLQAARGLFRRCSGHARRLRRRLAARAPVGDLPGPLQRGALLAGIRCRVRAGVYYQFGFPQLATRGRLPCHQQQHRPVLHPLEATAAVLPSSFIGFFASACSSDGRELAAPQTGPEPKSYRPRLWHFRYLRPAPIQ
jgi:hypothetical protein